MQKLLPEVSQACERKTSKREGSAARSQVQEEQAKSFVILMSTCATAGILGASEVTHGSATLQPKHSEQLPAS
eukprot:3982475-Amphidinium_carterae.1